MFYHALDSSQISQKSQNNNTAKFDISNKPNGLYFVRITTEQGTKVEKLIKE